MHLFSCETVSLQNCMQYYKINVWWTKCDCNRGRCGKDPFFSGKNRRTYRSRPTTIHSYISLASVLGVCSPILKQMGPPTPYRFHTPMHWHIQYTMVYFICDGIFVITASLLHPHTYCIGLCFAFNLHSPGQAILPSMRASDIMKAQT